MNEVKPEKKCEDCVNWSEHRCVDKHGNHIERFTLEGMKFWTYEVCTKNWALPQNAHYTGTNCKFYRVRKNSL